MDEYVAYYHGSKYKIIYVEKKNELGLLFYTIELVSGTWSTEDDLITLCHNSIQTDINVYKVRHCGGAITSTTKNIKSVKVHIW